MDPYRIILADDHVMIRQGLRKLIEGVDDLEIVGEAGDGKELLTLMNTLISHLVILDISMPNLSGIEAIREIKMKHAEVKVLILTMHKEYLHQALAAGADGYLVKEDADRELFSAIEHIRRNRVFISPRLSGALKEGGSSPGVQLSPREIEVLRHISEGKSNKEIADILCISFRTVESHRAAILNKLNLTNTAALVKYAIQAGIV